MATTRVPRLSLQPLTCVMVSARPWGVSRPAASRDQVVVRARGEIGEVIKGVGEGMGDEVTSLFTKQFAVCRAILPTIVLVYVRL